jgi:hypothetical protein
MERDIKTELEREAKAVRANMYKLQGFINGEVFKTLSEPRQVLMRKQLTIMHELNSTLLERAALEK